MKEDIEIYKVMLELAEDENNELTEEIITLQTLVSALKGYNTFLEKKNKELLKEYDNLTSIDKRYN
jgi:hypothetical protein